MTEIEILNNRQSFLHIFETRVMRDGRDDLLEWIDSTHFFEDPASTKYHLNEPGGLCKHSLNVYHRLVKLMEDENIDMTDELMESVTIVSLLHDLCKANCYSPAYRNVKTYDPEKVAMAPRFQVKHDNGGDFIWESVQTYSFNDDFVFGHGEKSVFLAMQHIKLTPQEAQAIRYHMSAWQDAEARSAGNAFSQNSLAFFLSIADSMATFLDEEEKK